MNLRKNKSANLYVYIYLSSENFKTLRPCAKTPNFRHFRGLTASRLNQDGALF